MRKLGIFLVILFGCGDCWAGPTTRPWVLHLPGVSGIRFVDHSLVAGLKDTHIDADIDMYDWTEHDPGVPALHAYQRNQKEAGVIAGLIMKRREAYPDCHIVITSHSGGGALAAWTLEHLPADVKVDNVIMLAPALSPGYDLSAALRHVTGRIYVFYSTEDELVLGLGCRLCGTMDGMQTDAAGKVSFTQPKNADADAYTKLVQYPYDPAWKQYFNFGDHIGPMSRPFVRAIVAPLVAGTPSPVQANAK